MKTVLYSLATDVGTFWIQPQPAGRVLLGIDGQHLRTYPSVGAAVEDVSARRTGHEPWDATAGNRAPIPLRKWKKGQTQRKPSSSFSRETAIEEPDEQSA